MKRLIPTLFLASLLGLLLAGPARAGAQQAPQDDPGTCTWREALVSYDREIVVQGATAAVEFEVADGCTVELSLVSYEAPTAEFDPSLADQQQLFDAVTEVYGPGRHRVEVALPDCFWQVDFVAGKPIEDLSPTNLYGNRRIASRTGGQACVSGATSTTTGEAPTTTAVLGATSTSTPGLLPFTGGQSTPMLLAGLGLVGGGLLILLVSRSRGGLTR